MRKCVTLKANRNREAMLTEVRNRYTRSIFVPKVLNRPLRLSYILAGPTSRFLFLAKRPTKRDTPVITKLQPAMVHVILFGESNGWQSGDERVWKEEEEENKKKTSIKERSTTVEEWTPFKPKRDERVWETQRRERQSKEKSWEEIRKTEKEENEERRTGERRYEHNYILYTNRRVGRAFFSCRAVPRASQNPPASPRGDGVGGMSADGEGAPQDPRRARGGRTSWTGFDLGVRWRAKAR